VVTIHCALADEAPSSRLIEGKATFTMLKSRTTTSCAASATMSPRGPNDRVPSVGFLTISGLPRWDERGIAFISDRFIFLADRIGKPHARA
jgi:hypothetical protein